MGHFDKPLGISELAMDSGIAIQYLQCPLCCFQYDQGQCPSIEYERRKSSKIPVIPTAYSMPHYL